jgi:DDE_Tnp_1-associated
MSAAPIPPLLPYLQSVPDPRHASGRRHPLAAILALSCAAMLAGCDSLLAIAEWGRDPHAGAPLAQRLGFTRQQTPCVATLHRVFRRVDVAAFERAVGAWAAATTAVLATAGVREAIALDGKTLRASRQATVPAVQLLGALGHDLGLVLAEAPIAVAGDEVGTLPALLADLVLAGRVVTVDAAFTERPVAAAILAKGGTI